MKYWFKNVADNIYIYPKSASRNLILQTRTSDCNSAYTVLFIISSLLFLLLLFYRITHSKRQYHIMNIAIKNSLTMNKNGVSKRYAFFVSMYYASRILDVHQERCSIFLGSLVRVQDLLFLLI